MTLPTRKMVSYCWSMLAIKRNKGVVFLSVPTHFYLTRLANPSLSIEEEKAKKRDKNNKTRGAYLQRVERRPPCRRVTSAEP